MEELKILYRDNSLVICVKPPAFLSQESDKEKNAPHTLKSLLGAPYIGTVHRLDKNVGGVMVYSLDEKITGKLSACLADKEKTVKEYLAVLCGVPQQPDGILKDLLFHDQRTNKTYVADRQRKGVREASLAYKILTVRNEKTLVLVRLHTGRTHQIRVQFSSRGLPLCGDGRYGGGKGQIALWSHRLSFVHPISEKKLDFSAEPVGNAFTVFFSDDQLLIK